MTPVDAAIEGLELRVYAKNQPEYVPLPARVDEHGTAITCWSLTWRERFKLLLSGKLYLTILTLNYPLQPVKLEVERPKVEYAN